MGKKNNVKEFLVNQDIYGHVFGVSYRGRSTYQTGLGSLCTLATYVLMVVNLLTLWIAFMDGSNQQEKTQTTALDRFNAEPVKFSDHNMTISLFSTKKLTPDYGRF